MTGGQQEAGKWMNQIAVWTAGPCLARNRRLVHRDLDSPAGGFPRRRGRGPHEIGPTRLRWLSRNLKVTSRGCVAYGDGEQKQATGRESVGVDQLAYGGQVAPQLLVRLRFLVDLAAGVEDRGVVAATELLADAQ